MSTDRHDILRELGLSPAVLRSDKHDLDNEFSEHPQHVWAVSEALAEARRERDEMKYALERMESRVRDEKSVTGDRKQTVKALDAAVAQDPEVRRAQRDLSDADYRVDMLAGLLGALQAKTSALKHLSELYQAGYYVSSSSRREASPPVRRRSTREDST